MDDNISRQPDAKKRGRPEGGIRKAARDLGLPEAQVRRALKVASLSPEAQDKARETGLDNNRSALLAAAKEVTAEGQVAVLILGEGAQKRRANQRMEPSCGCLEQCQYRNTSKILKGDRFHVKSE
jgi:hypothetical protein